MTRENAAPLLRMKQLALPLIGISLGSSAGRTPVARLLLTLLLAASVGLRANEAGHLERDFNHPPRAAQPWAWWFWNDGNISAEGIRKDLAEMDRVGMGGINLFNVAAGVPPGPVRFMSPAWLDMVRLSGEEAKRRGMPFIMHNVAGWSGSGGPWVKLEESMQILTWSETTVQGTGAAITLELPQPATIAGHYRDIAVLAFPLPAVELQGALPRPAITTNLPDLDVRPLVDGKSGATVSLPQSREAWLQLDYPRPITAASVVWSKQNHRLDNLWVTLEALAPNGGWREVTQFDLGTLNTAPVHVTTTATFASTTAQRWRMTWRQTAGEVAARSIDVDEITLLPGARVHDYEFKAGLVRRWGHDGGSRPTPAYAEESLLKASIVAPDQILDLSRYVRAPGKLEWQAPVGRWTILRLGHTTNGRKLAPAPKESIGWEPDKLASPSPGVEGVFTHYVDKLLAPEGADLRGKLNAIETDSWEHSTQSWTAGLREEFQRRRGYDPLPWLVVSAGGRIVGSAAQSEAFLWDMRQVLSELIAENYYGVLQRRAHERGMGYYSESAGAQQFLYDGITYLRKADVPMGEFWVGASGLRADCKLAASVGQLYDRPIIAAESFTGRPAWREHPGNLKALLDSAFCAGINQVIIHNSSHQPWDGPGPGATLGPWGINHNRLSTWWDQSTAFNAYIARCSTLLQKGHTVSDILYMLPEGPCHGLSYATGPWRSQVPGIVPAGYDFTVCNPLALRERIAVRNGRFATPTGASFALLVLSDRRDMTPETLRLIAGYVHSGGTVIGPKPTHSPSLRDWTQAQVAVRQLADEVWGDCDGAKVQSHRYGSGTVHWGKPLDEVLRGMKKAPDVAWTGVPAEALDYLHRRVENTEVYFVTNRTAASVNVEASFRVAGLTPSFWNAETGQRSAAAIFRAEGPRTVVPLALAPHGSVFVVFQAAAAPAHFAAITGPQGVVVSREVTQAGRYTLQTSDGRTRVVEVNAPPVARTIEGPWDVSFQAPRRDPFAVTLPHLRTWSEHADERIKYFSGSATYRRSLEISSTYLQQSDRVYLDLGQVEVMAEVKINHQDFGVIWKEPFRVDVTAALRPGENHLEIRVTNLWVNRLIGDEQLPADLDFADTGRLKSVPAWVSQGSPRPTSRQTFTFWRHYEKDSPLLLSGLVGPVRLESVSMLPAAGEP